MVTGNAVAFDGRGGLFVSGGFAGTRVLGNTTLTAPGSPQLYVARFDGQGNALWATQSVGVSPPPQFDETYAAALGADASGNVYVAGDTHGSVRFGSLPATTTGSADVFLAALTVGSVLATRPSKAGLALVAYPNPTSGLVTLRLPVGGGQLAVVDALGRTARQQALPAAAGDCSVSLAGLAPGLYQLRATLGNGQPATAPLLVR